MCVLLWQGHAFQSKWAEDSQFLWEDDAEELIPGKDNVIRLMMWMVYEYGQDVINAPFHLSAKNGGPSIYEGETLLHMAVARKSLGNLSFPCLPDPWWL